ncbi:MAG: CHAT domain-containing protein, partial [Pseudanabaena sp.]
TCLHLLTNVEPINLFDDSENKWIWRDYLASPVTSLFGIVLDKMVEIAMNRRYQSASEILQSLNTNAINQFNNHEIRVGSSAPSAQIPPSEPNPINSISKVVDAISKRLRTFFATDIAIDEITRSDITEFSDHPESSLQSLKRYPNLDCPDKTILNQRFSLNVELLLDQPEDQPESASVNIEDTGTDKLPEVEVVLSHSGFDLEGSNTQIIEVERDDDSSVRFVLIPRKLGQHKIKVQFYQNGKPIGKSVRNVLVSEQPVTVEVPQPDQPNDIELKTTLTIPPQDLELYIDLADDNRTLSFGLHSVKPEIDYHRTKLGKVTLQGSPLEKMQSVYKEMTQLAQRTPTTDEDKRWAEHRLESVGNELWDELIPERLKQEYWKFKSRVKSVLITSEEPWIPWEMLKPYRDNDDGEQENDLFWCQQFAISRWLSGAGTADELDMKNTRSIAPKQVNLPSVKEEIAFLESLADLRSSVTPLTSFSTRTQVLDSLKNEDLSVLHFACHGLFDSTSPDDSAISLSDGALRPSDIRVKFGGKRQRSLIFINACHGGRAEFSFTGLGGWADRLVNARAGAFIGASLSLTSHIAPINAPARALTSLSAQPPKPVKLNSARPP